MSKLEELIKELCPNGVEYKSLWEVSVWDKKFNGTAKEEQKGVTKYIHVSSAKLKSLEIENGDVKLLSTGNYDGYTNYELSKDYINEGEIFTIPSGGSANIKYYNGLFVDSGNIIGQSKDITKVLTKYIYYWLANSNETIQNLFRGSGVKHPDMVGILHLTLPVPPLEVQCEIVHILDDFTLLSALLSAELSAELKARQKQYEYYKNELYSFKEKEIEYIKLKEIAEIYRGGNFQKKDFVGNGKPCIHYGQIYTKYGKIANETYTFVNEDVYEKSKQARKNDIVMAVTSENIEDVCKCVVWQGDENIAVSGHTAIIHTSSKINARYLGYYFSTLHFFKDKAKLAHGTKVIEVTPSSLNEILIPVPSIEEQEEIANKIEKLDKLCNDISEGLPAEIKARQKQYEYYRDKLLNFKELKVEN